MNQTSITFRRLPAAGLLILTLLLSAMLGGCLTAGKEFNNPFAGVEHDANNTPRLSCFLTISNYKGPAIRLEVAALEILADSRWLAITSGSFKIDSAAIGSSQLFLGAVGLEPGSYSRLRLMITKGEVLAANGKYEVIIAEPSYVELNLTPVLSLGPEDSRSLLITWDVQNSLKNNNTLVPQMTVILPLKQILRDLVFVSCPDIDTIFVIRADKNWVVDSFGLKGGPTFLAIDPNVSRQRLYVLAFRERILKVIDLSSYRIVDFYPVSLNDKPTFMSISPDGDSAFLLDENSGYISRIDLPTGQIGARVLLADQPKYATYLDKQNLLAVTLSLSQEVILLDPVSLRKIGAISTGSRPQGLAVLDNQLYIAEYGNNTVSVVNMDSRGTERRLTVGLGPRRILAIGNQIYVSNYLEGSLSVLIPDQFGVIQDIYDFNLPLEMAFNQFYSRLYVADLATGGLSVIDTNSNTLLGHIDLGARPFDLDVIQ